MKLAIFANTPAQIHFYRNIARLLNEHGHDIIFLLRDYRETRIVADLFGIRYHIYAHANATKASSLWAFSQRMITALKILKQEKPDIISGFGVYDAYSSAILGFPSVEFTDTEPNVTSIYSLQVNMYMPFVDTIVTPSSFAYDFGKRQIRVQSFKELSYLHKRYFSPNSSIFDFLDISKNEEFALIRFNAFDAVHDAGIRGFNVDQKRRLVYELEKYCKVFISSEGKIPSDLANRILRIPKHRIHDVLGFAKLFVCDSQTMATEAGIIGTPTIRCNSFVGKNDMSNFREMEEKYGLILNFTDPEEAISKAKELIGLAHLKSSWKKKRDALLHDKIDIARFMVWLFEEYPMSKESIRNNPDIFLRFK